jgi:hypothetical protein
MGCGTYLMGLSSAINGVIGVSDGIANVSYEVSIRLNGFSLLKSVKKPERYFFRAVVSEVVVTLFD